MTFRPATLLTAAFFLLVAPIAASSFLRVPPSTDLRTLDLHPLQTIDYGTFRWLEISDVEATRLTGAGQRALVVASAGEIRVGSFFFDPLRDGEPAALVADSAPQTATGRGLRLVQLQGPPKSEWVAALESSGVRVLQYYPFNSYLVWADAAALQRAGTLPFVRWSGDFHPAYKIAGNLAGRSGRISNVLALVFDEGSRSDGGTAADSATDVATHLTAAGAGIVRNQKASSDGTFRLIELTTDAASLDELASEPHVVALAFHPTRPRIEDEMSDQILAGNHPGGVPVTGYSAHLATLGVDGTGVIWAVSDTGIDWDHPDLSDHIVGGFSPADADCTIAGQPGTDCPTGGHGTHVAGILAGDATSGFTDASGFLFGLGIAPATSLFANNIFAASVGIEEAVTVALHGGAIGSNNSWTWLNIPGAGYTLEARMEDILVRDADSTTGAVAEPFIQVFSAGNSGSGAATITDPKEAKNIIVVGSSLNARAGSIDALDSSSSRGPAIDGRKLPTVTAPGSQIASTRNDTGGSCSTAIAGTSNRYAFCSGTSMATPHVSGAVVLATQWWRTTHAGANPSMAMAKALLINSAVDMGTADIPNNNEGWGRVNITRMIQPAAATFYSDQERLLTDTGDTTAFYFTLATPAQPLRVSLVWSDAPGATDANPALVNDLDLGVTAAGVSYHGNVFVSGASVTGGASDTLNNLENVFLNAPTAGKIKVVIAASTIAGDGVPLNASLLDQDFALVCSNCVPAIFFDGFESTTTNAWSLSVP